VKNSLGAPSAQVPLTQDYDDELERDLIRALSRAVVFETPPTAPLGTLELITALAACLGATVALLPNHAPIHRRALRVIAKSVNLGLRAAACDIGGRA
jgi:hypothetical protein